MTGSSSRFEVIVAPAPELAAIFSKRLTEIRLENAWTLAVPGGSVAEVFFPVLAAAELDWQRLHLFWGDERAVPPGHSDSNYRIAAERLLGRAPLDARNVHRMRADGVEHRDALSAYMFPQVTRTYDAVV